MNRANDQDLLAYTLGGLDPDDQDRIDMQVREDESLARRVEQLRTQLAPLDALAGAVRPRTGLARRTCECIAAVPLRREFPAPPPRPIPNVANQAAISCRGAAPATRRARFGERREVSGGPARSSAMSLVIVAVVLMLLAAIILPAVNYSRFQSRVVACQGNLQIAGMSLLQYADQHGGTHLTIPLDEKLGIAGFFGPQLLESGFVDDPVTFLCPGVSDDSRGNATSATRIPTLGQLESADGASLVSLQRRAGGDYAFSIGQQVDGHYAPTRNLGRPTYALLADAPSAGLPGRASANHGGKGQNVFFEDGQIRFLALPVVDGASIFENDLGIVAPGIHADDSVLAPSAIRIVKATSMLVD